MTNPKLRRGRSSEQGAFYTVTTVVRDRRPIFTDHALASLIVGEIEACDTIGWVETCAWVVMPDHVHWLFQLCAHDLSGCIQAFKSRGARAVNDMRGLHGPVWQHGFYDHRLRDDEDLLSQARYIVTNPVRGGLVDRIEDHALWWCRWIQRQPDL